ncbi:MAG: bifunctional [glutamine synthetase] adenylyltransferase/[glutamine synthetase]-adenylyl-L-tyrosine phosphorylase [Actinobacteria bacterium]|nr:bifunctional [glutamine synthetase] adenylyltransferase/[glutamine synthetase]-adenylyl-L-tyrosine phosphorylase [Actinomycetota bacterium]
MTDRAHDPGDEAFIDLGFDATTTARIRTAVAASADPDGALARIAPVLAADESIVSDEDRLRKVAAIAGASRALSKTLAKNPHLLDGAAESDSVSLRVQAALVMIAGDDLAGHTGVREATGRFSSAIDQIVGGALETATEQVKDRHPLVDELGFAVIAMGKWGARELNYYSDIDLVFVHTPVEGQDSESRSAALAIAGRLVSSLSAPTLDGLALQIDADLRPEGAMGPLTRSLDGYRSYYARWGEAWELQALLKARPAAGDVDVGRRFREMADQIIWERGLDVDALRSIRLLKAQAEDAASSTDLKRSRGGIRDIEFTVQLLQLVHGRFDPDLRVLSTLDAIEALGDHDYIETHEAESLTDAYIFLRNVEHRIQLWDLRQTHQFPASLQARERIGRSLGFTADPAGNLVARLDEVKREVRELHERLYFRPVLDSLVGLPTARLDPTEAALRLEALGFSDVVAAATAFEELTAGLTRRSRVMHQALPLMLDWLSQSPDPDLGLSQLRLLLAHSPDHGALVTLLQNNPVAGERLCILLGTGKLLGDLIDRIPEFIPRLADDKQLLDVRDRHDATERLLGLLDSRPDTDAKIGTIRRFVRRRKLRIAARDVLGEAPMEATLGALSDSADAAITGALHILTPEDPGGFGVIAMGKWGGHELSYGSDVDLMYVFDDEHSRDRGLHLATGLRRVLSEPSRYGEAYELDADLRPEGRKGPMARSLDGFRRYYAEWSEPWELLALVRARPAAGDEDVLESFTAITEPVIWRDQLPDEVVRAIRSIKARVEAERIPPGEDADFHLKLGPGGLSDIEFLTQLLQLRHGGAVPELRVTGTFPALHRLREAEILSAAAYDSLHDSYLFCTRVRLRLHLQQGSVSNSLPTDPDSTARLAASLGFDRTAELREQYRRYTRRARRSFEQIFYE